MNILRTSIFIACIMGIITLICNITIPEKFKKQISLTLTLVTILSIGSLFIKGGIKINPDFDSLKKHAEQNSSVQSALTLDMINLTQQNLSESIKQRLDDPKIKDVKALVVINDSSGEYNCIELKSVQVITDKNFEDTQKIIKRVREICENENLDVAVTKEE